MRAWIGITDETWYRFLHARPELDEVNFWKPGGRQAFKVLDPGELFLFKLHSPHQFIVGGGIFAHFSFLPSSLAWEAFGEKNGAATAEEMRARIEKYRRIRPAVDEDYQIGCVLLQQPFFLDPGDWIPAPPDWPIHTVQGATYDLTAGAGLSVWERLQVVLAARTAAPAGAIAASRFGAPYAVTPRLGQGSFRILVTDSYERRCAVTGERTLPVLDAAHIRPYAKGGEHRIDNGLLLRKDLHTLFDRGYVTVTPDYRFRVSPRIRREFENGREYYALDDREIRLPSFRLRAPSPDVLDWHNRKVFRS